MKKRILSVSTLPPDPAPSCENTILADLQKQLTEIWFQIVREKDSLTKKQLFALYRHTKRVYDLQRMLSSKAL